MSEIVIGIDIGTASSKGVATRPDGTVVATAVRDHEMSLPRPDHAEMDAEQVWWADVVALSRELVAELGGAAIAGVAVSGIGPCVVPVDREGTALRPGILYGIDGRATVEIDELTERFGRDRIVERCGNELSTQSAGPKLRWLERHEPEVWARTVRWDSAHSYVVRKLTGEHVLDHHTASQCDPFYDLATNDWCHDWIEDVLPDVAFPRLAWPGETVGTVHRAAAELTGLPEGTPVVAGCVDAWAEAFSAGVRAPGDLMLMYGSTMFLVQVLRSPRAEPKLWTTVGVDRGSSTLAAGMSTSGSLTGWLRDLTGDVPFEQLVAEAAATPPGSDGLLVLPYFAGERTPVFDPQARGVVVGLTLRHGRGHLFRAIYEGIAFGIRQILELFESADDPATRIVAIGGGTKSALWTQVVSDVTGRTQTRPRQAIGACYGGALLAAMGAGLVSDREDWSVTDEVIEPDERNRARYDELYDAYTELYPATRSIAHRLAALQGGA